MNPPTKQQIREWLDRIEPAIAPKNPREWLAERIGASKATVDNWLSKKEMTATTAKFIGEIMRDHQFDEPRFTMEEAQTIREAMRALDYQNFSDFAREIIIQRAREEQNKRCKCPLAAERASSYTTKKTKP